MLKPAVIVFGLFFCSMLPVAFGTPVGQQDEAATKRETAAITAVENAGGRVSQIAADGPSREISFYLSGKPITDQQLKSVESIGNVIWVNLAGTQISNDGLKSLAGLPLVKLHLEKTKIGDAGLVHLKKLKQLEYLNLYDTQVTDAGLEHLVSLKHLKKLYVWKTSVTESGMEKLRTALPDLKIVGAVKFEAVVTEKPEPKKATPKPTKPTDKKADSKKPDSKKTSDKTPADKPPEDKKTGGSPKQ